MKNLQRKIAYILSVIVVIASLSACGAANGNQDEVGVDSTAPLGSNLTMNETVVDSGQNNIRHWDLLLDFID